jgi:putative spermidine/putrescine transport system ATP-binding protein
MANRQDASSTGLAVCGLEKTYGRDVQALRGIDLRAEEGEFVTLLGPSGSGKTTLLMVIGGFEAPTRGAIFHRGTEITAIPPERRNFGVVFQSYALFPHMTARRNIEYPLAARGICRRERRDMVQAAISLVGLKGLEERRPAQLSGGQQQRVALARALVYQPSLLLLDEPLGALDRALRERMQAELKRIHKETGVTFLYVTHDQEEALTMSDRIAILRLGQIEQIGTPQELYERPATEFVATFLGLANRLRGRVASIRQDVADIQLQFGPLATIPCLSQSVRPGMIVHVIVRPEKIRIKKHDPELKPTLQIEGLIDDIVFLGSLWRYQVQTAAGAIQVRSTVPSGAAVGEAVWLEWTETDSWAIPVGPASGESVSSAEPVIA